MIANTTIRTHGQWKSRRGFTLIELLVTISIIALLIAILLPALSRARVTVRIAVCASNLRQMAIGLTTYANDFNDYLPARRDSDDPNVPPLAWGVHLTDINVLTKYSPTPSHFQSGFYQSGYVTAPETYFCPSNVPGFTSHTYAEDPAWDIYWNTQAGGRTSRSSYMYMAGLGGNFLVKNGKGAPAAVRITDSVDLRLMQDLTVQFISTGVYQYNHPERIRTDTISGFNGGNASYLDGHVQWLPDNEMEINKNHITGSSRWIY